MKGAKDVATTGSLRYRDIGDYLTREDKLRILAAQDLETVPWEGIIPSSDGDWINQRDKRFAKFQPISDKVKKVEIAPIFEVFSRGLETGRDAWVYRFSLSQLIEGVQASIEFYNQQVTSYAQHRKVAAITNPTDRDVDEFIDRDPSKISWNRVDKIRLAKGTRYSFAEQCVREATYRPFCKQWVYFDSQMNSYLNQLPRISPSSEQANIGFYITGTGADEPFSVLMVDTIPDLHAVGTRSVGPFFPRYSYRELAIDGGFDFSATEPYERVDNITDGALAAYRKAYSVPAITKDDIFFYTYALLHSPEYRNVFAADLKRSVPRIPKVQDFHGFAAAGRKLSELHLNYETATPYPGIVEDVKGATSSTLAVELYRRNIGRWLREGIKKRVERSPIIGEKDLPGLEMRNRALDGSADRTDLVIVFVFTRVEFTVLWLLSLRDVARPLKSLVRDNRSGKVENLLYLAFPLLHVMVTSGSRVRYEDNAPEFVADHQAAMASSLIFPGPHLGGVLP